MNRTEIEDPKSIEAVESFANKFLNFSQGPIAEALRELGHSISVRSGRLVSFDEDFDLSNCTVTMKESDKTLTVVKADGEVIRLDDLRAVDPYDNPDEFEE